MKLYKLSGTERYIEWDILHNQDGYTESATDEVQFKSVGGTAPWSGTQEHAWGDALKWGFWVPVTKFADASCWIQDVWGWHDLNALASVFRVWPSNSSEMVLTHPDYGSSPAVFIVFEDGAYYLIQKDLSQGWITEEQYSARGWQLPDFIVLNADTGAILGAAKGREMETALIPSCTLGHSEMVSVTIPPRSLEGPDMVVYVPSFSLPTVSTGGDFGSSNLFKFASGGGDYTFGANVVTSIYRLDNGDYAAWDSSKQYAVIYYRDYGSTYTARTGITTVNGSDFGYSGNYIYAHNVSGSSITVARIKIAVCSSNQATVVTVYGSNNVAYNSFKFTASGTDYYYVLDGVQTDWTDDLEGIGYRLILVAWFNSDKSNYYLSTGRSRELYDASGGRIDYDSTKTYTIIRFENAVGDNVTPSNLTYISLIGYNGGTTLGVRSATGGPTLSAVASVYYLIS